MAKYYVSTFNLNTGAIFDLPTFYTDRNEAILHGQNYVRDRQYEDGSVLFFRVQKTENDTVPASWNIFEEVAEEMNDDDDECNGCCASCDCAESCPSILSKINGLFT